MVAELQKPNGNNGAASSTPAIAVSHIVKTYGDFTAVDDISFRLAMARSSGLLGPNGAGKSTLIRMMTTLIPITGGTAHIAGFDVSTHADDVRHCLGVIPQAMTSDLDLTLDENLSIYAKLYGVPTKEREQSMDELSNSSTSPSGAARRPRHCPAVCVVVSKSRADSCTSRNFLPRRAHHRTRSRVACRRLGNAHAHQGTSASSPC